jgi:hypothetical protein
MRLLQFGFEVRVDITDVGEKKSGRLTSLSSRLTGDDHD